MRQHGNCFDGSLRNSCKRARGTRQIEHPVGRGQESNPGIALQGPRSPCQAGEARNLVHLSRLFCKITLPCDPHTLSCCCRGHCCGSRKWTGRGCLETVVEVPLRLLTPISAVGGLYWLFWCVWRWKIRKPCFFWPIDCDRITHSRHYSSLFLQGFLLRLQN